MIENIQNSLKHFYSFKNNIYLLILISNHSISFNYFKWPHFKFRPDWIFFNKTKVLFYLVKYVPHYFNESLK